MADIQALIADPEFRQLAPTEQKQVLAGVDPDFSGLTDEEFKSFLEGVGTPTVKPESKSPYWMRALSNLPGSLKKAAEDIPIGFGALGTPKTNPMFPPGTRGYMRQEGVGTDPYSQVDAFLAPFKGLANVVSDLPSAFEADPAGIALMGAQLARGGSRDATIRTAKGVGKGVVEGARLDATPGGITRAGTSAALGGLIRGAPGAEAAFLAAEGLPMLVKGAQRGAQAYTGLPDFKKFSILSKVPEDVAVPGAPGGAVLGPEAAPPAETPTSIPQTGFPSERKVGGIQNAVEPKTPKPVKTWNRKTLSSFSKLQKGLAPEPAKPVADVSPVVSDLPSGRKVGGIQNQVEIPQPTTTMYSARVEVPRGEAGTPSAPPEGIKPEDWALLSPKQQTVIRDAVTKGAANRTPAPQPASSAVAPKPADVVDETGQPLMKGGTEDPTDLPGYITEDAPYKNIHHKNNGEALIQDITKELKAAGATKDQLQQIMSDPAAATNFWDAMSQKLGRVKAADKIGPDTIQRVLRDYDPGPKAFARPLLKDFAGANGLTEAEAEAALKAEGWDVA